MKKKYIAVLVLILVVLAGVSYQLYQYQRVKEGLSVEGVELRSVNTEGIGSIPTEITIDLNLNVRNSSNYSLEIEELSYSIKVGGRNFGHSSIRSKVLHANTVSEIPIRVNASSTDVIKTTWDYIAHGGFELQVSGRIEVPFKLFGTIELFTITRPFQKSSYVERQGIRREMKGATDITLQPPPSQVREGEVVRFEGRLTVEGGKGLPNKEIQIADDDGIGDDVIAKGFTDKNGYYSISWSAKHTDPLGGDPEIYAKFLGSSNYGESDSGERCEVEVVSK